jgi:hypothetical protein
MLARVVFWGSALEKRIDSGTQGIPRNAQAYCLSPNMYMSLRERAGPVLISAAGSGRALLVSETPPGGPGY